MMSFVQVNGSLPERIVVYRDGVGDGALGTVQQHEVPQFVNCFKDFTDLNYQPEFAMIVVQKRINTRIFGLMVRADLEL